MTDHYKRWFRKALDIKDSPNPHERECVVLGVNEDNGSPFFLPIPLLAEHMHPEGPAGGGKTSRALAPLLEQLAHRQQFSIVCVDLKGDSNELYPAATCGYHNGPDATRTKWFTDRVGFSTFPFNLFEQRFWPHLSPAQKASTLGAALGTTHGLSEYGSQWFGGAAFEVMQRVFERADVKSFRGLAEAIHHLIIHGKRDDLHPDIRSAGLQAFLDARRMASVQALNVVGNPHGIDLCSYFEKPQSLYVSLPSGVSHEVAGAIFRLFLFGLFDAAAHVRRRVQVFLFADEFQRGISKGLETVLQQARSCGIGLILANQTIHDLVTKEKDFRPTMKACCRCHWQFGEPSPAFQKALAETGGEYEGLELSETVEPHPISGRWVAASQTARPVQRQRFPINEVKRVTGDPRLSFFTSSGDYGLYQYGPYPLVVEGDYHITREEYERRKATPWPDAVEGCIVTELPPRIDDTPPPDDPPPPVERISRRTKIPSPPPRRSKE